MGGTVYGYRKWTKKDPEPDEPEIPEDSIERIKLWLRLEHWYPGIANWMVIMAFFIIGLIVAGSLSGRGA